jgi:hypothetical protein
MGFKEGDKVVIKPAHEIEIIGEQYVGLTVRMLGLAGKIAVITKMIDSQRCTINLGRPDHWWDVRWLDFYYEYPDKGLRYRVGDKVRIKRDLRSIYEGNRGGMPCIMGAMKAMEGTIQTIAEIGVESYYVGGSMTTEVVRIVGTGLAWSVDYLELIDRYKEPEKMYYPLLTRRG